MPSPCRDDASRLFARLGPCASSTSPRPPAHPRPSGTTGLSIANEPEADRGADDLAQLYRRAYFSILIANRDDHLRNHGFLRTANGWHLSPAFDINPNPDKDAHEIYLGIDADPSASSALLRNVSEYYFVDHKTKAKRHAAAEKIEAEVRDALTGWQAIAKGLGIPRAEMQDLEAIIDLAR